MNILLETKFRVLSWGEAGVSYDLKNCISEFLWTDVILMQIELEKSHL